MKTIIRTIVPLMSNKAPSSSPLKTSNSWRNLSSLPDKMTVNGAKCLDDNLIHKLSGEDEKLVRLGGSDLDLDKFSKIGVDVIKRGGVIAVPTDTVYGIAADAQNNDAIARIYKIKGRDFRNPIAICVHSIEEVYKWGKVQIDPNLLHDLLPGPVTLVFERQSTLNPNLNPHTNLIGIRIPDNNFIVQLAKFHDGPIALTSANFSADPSTLQVEEFKELWPSLDLIFDGGRLSSCDKTEKAARAGSTIIDLSKSGYYSIIREGTAHVECTMVLENKYKLKRTNSLLSRPWENK